MKQKDLEILVGVIFVATFAVFYWYHTPGLSIDPVFISISTFLFAILAGFFISRQSGRYQNLRKSLSDFDGVMSAIYRNSQHFGAVIHGHVGKIIKDHYKRILESHQWDYYFTHKSSTLTDIHDLFDKEITKLKNVNEVEHFAVVTSLSALAEAQKIRKNLVSLHLEKIPKFQLVLIYFLTAIVLVSISSIDTQGDFFESLLKAAFVTSVIVVIILLHQLDKLALFEGVIGESSARDVVEIIEGKK